MKVLIIEDDAAIREGLEELVGELADVCAVATLDEALGALARQRFQLVLTDLALGADREGGQEIIASATRSETPVAVITAASHDLIRSQLGGSKVEAVLMKPFQLEDVTALVRRFRAD